MCRRRRSGDDQAKLLSARCFDCINIVILVCVCDRRRGARERMVREDAMTERLTRRMVLGGSIAGLLAATGQPFAQAKEELLTAAGGGAGTDLLVLEPGSAQFVGLTQGFNRRWTAPNCTKIFVPLTGAGAQAALTQAIAFG